ncbi:uncharacterized protein LOC123229201 [Mangifera indica]|uniref:uncharacterized protein LOC123229201 n=1 Tax=Mangifera indica TaxID=29780 RepID=UPI001CFB1BEB|nr:uncharacterized protein LOC123229201 [Mangifera indica]
MVGVFKRSLSFPNKHPNRPSKPPISHHVRSVSLPCRSHPLISQIKTEINELKIWSSKSENRTSAWLCDGLRRLKDVHDSLDDILQLPQTQESLRNQHQWVEKLLEDFLRFVDVYGIFQTSVLALKEEQLAAQVAIRKKDDSRVALYLKARKKIAKEMVKLASAIRCIGQYPVPRSLLVSNIANTELAGVVCEAVEVTLLVTEALFSGISSSFASRKSSWMGLRLSKRAKSLKVEESIEEFQQVSAEILWGLRKKDDEHVDKVLKKMQHLEGCICSVDSVSEKAFRSLINTRVSLLNTLTHH